MTLSLVQRTNQSRTPDFEKYRETVYTQEQVIEKLERMLEASVRANSEGKRGEKEQVRATEQRMREEAAREAQTVKVGDDDSTSEVCCWSVMFMLL